MADINSSIERLDLRFRATPPKSGKARLWGAVWLWFLMGAVSGVSGWIYSRDLVQRHLAKQLEPERDSADVLLAIEALHLLGNEDESYLVRGLAHPDVRVLRSAIRKINAGIDRTSQSSVATAGDTIQRLVEQLRDLPNDLPAENRLLISGLAARLYADCIRLEQPQLHDYADYCLGILRGPSESSPKQLLAVKAATAPPALPPLPKSAESSRLSDDLGPDDAEPDRARVTLSSTGLPRSNLRVANAAPPPLAPATGMPDRSQSDTNRRLSDDGDDDDGIDDPDFDEGNQEGVNLRDESSANHHPAGSSRIDKFEHRMLGETVLEQPVIQDHRIPIMVGVPASVSQEPVVRMKLISDQPNFQGIENAEIAELVRLLGSENADLAKAAALTLSQKGFSGFEIELATELSLGTTARRLELVQQIAASDQVNPRPWLVWMAEDGQPEVRRMSISLLSSMMDDPVQRSLKILLSRETDSEIRDLIRRVLSNTKR